MIACWYVHIKRGNLNPLQVYWKSRNTTRGEHENVCTSSGLHPCNRRTGLSALNQARPFHLSVTNIVWQQFSRVSGRKLSQPYLELLEIESATFCRQRRSYYHWDTSFCKLKGDCLKWEVCFYTAFLGFYIEQGASRRRGFPHLTTTLQLVEGDRDGVGGTSTLAPTPCSWAAFLNAQDACRRFEAHFRTSQHPFVKQCFVFLKELHASIPLCI